MQASIIILIQIPYVASVKLEPTDNIVFVLSNLEDDICVHDHHVANSI